MTESDNSSIYTMLYIALVSNMTSTCIGFIGTICSYIYQKIVIIYRIVIDKILDKLYGPKIMITESHVCSNKYVFPVLGDEYRQYLEDYHGQKISTYKQKNYKKIIANTASSGNILIGIDFTSEKLEGNAPSYNNSYTFYTRIHTKQELNDLATKFYRKTHNYITSRCIVIRDDVDGSFSQFKHNITGVPDKIYIPEIYADIKKILTTKDTANILLYGPPGTGKTNIIKKLAWDLEAVLFIVNPKKFTSIEKLRNYLSTKTFITSNRHIVVPNRKYFLFEDFDATMPEAFWDKSNESDELSSDKNDKKITYNGVTYTYSDLINLLDGVIKLKNVYMFFTTNHLDVFPKSFIRPGRMHYKACIDLLSIDQMIDFIRTNFENESKSIKAKTLRRSLHRRAAISEMYALKDVAKSLDDFIEKINDDYLSKL